MNSGDWWDLGMRVIPAKHKTRRGQEMAEGACDSIVSEAPSAKPSQKPEGTGRGAAKATEPGQSGKWKTQVRKVKWRMICR